MLEDLDAGHPGHHQIDNHQCGGSCCTCERGLAGGDELGIVPGVAENQREGPPLIGVVVDNQNAWHVTVESTIALSGKTLPDPSDEQRAM